MSDLKPATSPAQPARIGEKLEDINTEIHDSQSFYKKVKGWSSNLLGAGVGLGLIVLLTPIKIPLLVAAAAFSLVGWGVTKVLAQSSAENIAKLQQTREELLTSHEQRLTAPQPVPALVAKKPAKASAPYNAASANTKSGASADAERIAALEKRLTQLQDEISGKPVVLDKPKSIVSRLGFGG